MSDIHAQYQKGKEPGFLRDLLTWSIILFFLFSFSSCAFTRMLTGELSFMDMVEFALFCPLLALPITWARRFIRYGQAKARAREGRR